MERKAVEENCLESTTGDLCGRRKIGQHPFDKVMTEGEEEEG